MKEWAYICVLAVQHCKWEYPHMGTVGTQGFEVLSLIASVPSGHQFEGRNRRAKSISSTWHGGKNRLWDILRSAAAWETRQCLEDAENQRSLANSSGSHSMHKEGRSLFFTITATQGQGELQLHPWFNRLTSNSGIHQYSAVWKYPTKSCLECGT